MKVYRYVSEKELQMILNGDTTNLGTDFSNGSYSNTHRYKDKVKYLHFFLNKKSIQYVKPFFKDRNCDFYIATFDIPIFTLLLHAGNGTYLPIGSGYDVSAESKVEFAVPIRKFKTSSLVAYELDKEHHEEIQSKLNESQHQSNT